MLNNLQREYENIFNDNRVFILAIHYSTEMKKKSIVSKTNTLFYQSILNATTNMLYRILFDYI